MAKVALLIGVNHFHASLRLPPKGQDVEALRAVLESIGFQVECAIDRSLQDTTETIESFFKHRQSDDQLLLLWATHALLDENSHLYFYTPNTAIDERRSLIKATTIPARFVQDAMNSSPARPQSVVLECGVPAIAAPANSRLDAALLQDQLGGTGRAILAATTPLLVTNHPAIDLWGYLRYWAEGLQTKAADTDSDGCISAADLHEYAKRKLQIAAPGIEPELCGSDETARIPLVEQLPPDPSLRYRWLLEKRALRTQPDQVDDRAERWLGDRTMLEHTRQQWEVSPDVARTIEAEVLRPLRDFRQRRQIYEQTVDKLTTPQNGDRPSRPRLDQFEQVRQALGLRSTDVAAVDAAVLLRDEQNQRRQQQQNLAEYEQCLLLAGQRQYPISESDRQTLQDLQQVLGLEDVDVHPIEQRLADQVEQLRGKPPVDKPQTNDSRLTPAIEPDPWGEPPVDKPQTSDRATASPFNSTSPNSTPTVEPSEATHRPQSPSTDRWQDRIVWPKPPETDRRSQPPSTPQKSPDPNEPGATEQQPQNQSDRAAPPPPDRPPQREGKAPAKPEPERSPTSDSAATTLQPEPSVQEFMSRNREALQQLLMQQGLGPGGDMATTRPPVSMATPVTSAPAPVNPPVASGSDRPPPPSPPRGAVAEPESPRRKPSQRRSQVARLLMLLFLAALPIVAFVVAWLATQSPPGSPLPGWLNLRKPPAGTTVAQLNTWGQIKARQGRYQEAIDEYNQALQLDANNAAVYINRGQAYHRLGKFQDALEDYDRAIALLKDKNTGGKLNRQLALAYSNRSHVRYDLGGRENWPGALEDANAAVALDSGLAQAFVNLANVRFVQGDPTGALADYKRAIDLNPTNKTVLAGAHTNRGNVLLSRNDLNAAFADYNRAVQIDPNFPEAYYNRGIAFQTIGNNPAAINNFRRAAQLYQQQGYDTLNQQALDRVAALQADGTPSTIAPIQIQ